MGSFVLVLGLGFLGRFGPGIRRNCHWFFHEEKFVKVVSTDVSLRLRRAFYFEWNAEPFCVSLVTAALPF